MTPVTFSAVPEEALAPLPVVTTAASPHLVAPSPTAARPAATIRATPTPRARNTLPPRVAGPRLSGFATWYRYVPNGAAAGPALRAWLGPDWRGQWVTVSHGRAAVRVHLTDWCLCSHGNRLVDLDLGSFALLADPGRGVVAVTVTR